MVYNFNDIFPNVIIYMSHFPVPISQHGFDTGILLDVQLAHVHPKTHLLGDCIEGSEHCAKVFNFAIITISSASMDSIV